MTTRFYTDCSLSEELKHWASSSMKLKHYCYYTVGHCTEIQSLAEQKLEQVQDKIKDLQSLEDVLSDLVRQCNASVDKAHCPIVDTLLKEN
jgi:4-hydroxy-3-methylbut-2-en-1-yl diphosphate synthase IspG/GcpE